MTHGSLFNGIGGFQLAAEWMGWENVFSCEIDDFCNQVTKKHFPNCIQHGDIKKLDGTNYGGAIDIITGGFPCQDISSGKNGDVFMLPNLASRTAEKEFMELPTPNAQDAMIVLTKVESYQKYYRNGRQDHLVYQCHLNGMTASQSMNVYELTMGFPKNWTLIESTLAETPLSPK